MNKTMILSQRLYKHTKNNVKQAKRKQKNIKKIFMQLLKLEKAKIISNKMLEKKRKESFVILVWLLEVNRKGPKTIQISSNQEQFD